MWHLSSNDKDETIKDIGSWIRRFLTWGSKRNTLDQSSLFNQQSNVRIHVRMLTYRCTSKQVNVYPFTPTSNLSVRLYLHSTSSVVFGGQLR